MSRGLGPLQREILAALDADHEANFVTADRRPVYDLRAIKETLAQRGHGRRCWLSVPALSETYVWHTAAFTASFSRAVTTLVARGLLQRHFLPTRKGGVDLLHTRFVSRTQLSVK